MMRPAPDVTVYRCVGPVDMRKQAASLALLPSGLGHGIAAQARDGRKPAAPADQAPFAPCFDDLAEPIQVPTDIWAPSATLASTLA
jgi:hypothetical protein